MEYCIDETTYKYRKSYSKPKLGKLVMFGGEIIKKVVLFIIIFLTITSLLTIFLITILFLKIYILPIPPIKRYRPNKAAKKDNDEQSFYERYSKRTYQ